MTDHPFSSYLRILGKGPKSRRPLTVEESIDAIRMVMDGQVTEKQLGAFLLLMRANGETPEELIGFVQGLRAYYQLDSQAENQIDGDGTSIDLDISAYAGKWRYPPYFLLSVKLLAQNGVKVLLHGDSGQFADRFYAESFMQDLGFVRAASLQEARQAAQQALPVYLPLQSFAPQLQSILHLKSELGVRTVFNTAVKLLNPLNAPVAMQGIFHKGVENLHHAGFQVNGAQRNLVFKGEGGEPEIRPDALNILYFSDRNHAELEAVKFAAVTERHPRPKQWQPQDLYDLWSGNSDDVYGYQAVIATLAAALMAKEQLSAEQALDLSEQWWHNRRI